MIASLIKTLIFWNFLEYLMYTLMYYDIKLVISI